MLCELAVDNIGTYVDVITQIDAEQQYRMWFRGQSDYSWGLVPSVQRKDGMGKNYEQYICSAARIHGKARSVCRAGKGQGCAVSEKDGAENGSSCGTGREKAGLYFAAESLHRRYPVVGHGNGRQQRI